MEHTSENMEEHDNDKKCYSCGKTFTSPKDLLRHKNRKTPCLIRDIKDEDKKNPLRCIYCNKIFSRLPNLTKHGRTCKIKNGGLDKLVDKVKHEEQIRIMQERQEKHDHELQQVRDDMKAQLAAQNDMFQALMEKMDEMKTQQIAVPAVATNNGVIHNGNVINNVNINVNNYTSPNADHLLTFEKFNELFMKEFAGLPIALACRMYFDPSHPENMSLHLINKSTGEMLAMVEGNWSTRNIDEVSEKMRAVGYEIAERGIKMHGRNLKYSDADYVCCNILNNVHHPGTTERDLREIKEKIVEAREITGSAPHIASKLEDTRAVGRVRKVRGVNNNQSIESTERNIVGDNIAN